MKKKSTSNNKIYSLSAYMVLFNKNTSFLTREISLFYNFISFSISTMVMVSVKIISSIMALMTKSYKTWHIRNFIVTSTFFTTNTIKMMNIKKSFSQFFSLFRSSNISAVLTSIIVSYSYKFSSFTSSLLHVGSVCQVDKIIKQ